MVRFSNWFTFINFEIFLSKHVRGILVTPFKQSSFNRKTKGNRTVPDLDGDGGMCVNLTRFNRTEALQASCLDVSEVADAWREAILTNYKKYTNIQSFGCNLLVLHSKYELLCIL